MESLGERTRLWYIITKSEQRHGLETDVHEGGGGTSHLAFITLLASHLHVPHLH